MGLFGRRKQAAETRAEIAVVTSEQETRADEVETDSSGRVQFDEALLTALIGGNTSITKEQAMQIPTVKACIGLIADRISALPIKLYEETAGEVAEITNDKRLQLLNGDTGDTLNATELKKRWVIDYFLGKGSYTYIQRDVFGELTGLYYVDESAVSVVPKPDPIFKQYYINVTAGAQEVRKKLDELNAAYETNKAAIKQTTIELNKANRERRKLAENMKDGGTKEQLAEMQECNDKIAQIASRIGALKSKSAEMRAELKVTTKAYEEQKSAADVAAAAKEAEAQAAFEAANKEKQAAEAAAKEQIQLSSNIKGAIGTFSVSPHPKSSITSQAFFVLCSP